MALNEINSRIDKTKLDEELKEPLQKAEDATYRIDKNIDLISKQIAALEEKRKPLIERNKMLNEAYGRITERYGTSHYTAEDVFERYEQPRKNLANNQKFERNASDNNVPSKDSDLWKIVAKFGVQNLEKYYGGTYIEQIKHPAFLQHNSAPSKLINYAKKIANRTLTEEEFEKLPEFKEDIYKLQNELVSRSLSVEDIVGIIMPRPSLSKNSGTLADAIHGELKNDGKTYLEY